MVAAATGLVLAVLGAGLLLAMLAVVAGAAAGVGLGSRPVSSASWVTVVAAAPTIGKAAPTISAYGTSATSAAMGRPR